jgi:hypothetical protein
MTGYGEGILSSPQKLTHVRFAGTFIPSTRNSLVSPDKISVGNFSATGCGNKKGMLSKRHGIYSEAPKGTEIKV